MHTDAQPEVIQRIIVGHIPEELQQAVARIVLKTLRDPAKSPHSQGVNGILVKKPWR